jgi:uncharacterized protein
MRMATPAAADRQLFVSLKLAEVCNLGCKYCYFFEHNDLSHLGAPAYMSPVIIEAAAKFLAGGAREVGIGNIAIALHGGEPLMLGKERFAQCCEILHREIGPHSNLRLIVQTNGLLLDDEWIELLARYGCTIGLSIDGMKESHDAIRMDKKRRGTYDRVMVALRLLQQAVADGRIAAFGVLGVIGLGMPGAATLAHFLDELKLTSFDFLVPQLHWDNVEPEMVDHVRQFYSEVVDAWLERGNPSIHIRTITDSFRPLLSEAAGQWRLNYIADMAEGVSIRSNGDVCVDDALPPISNKFRDTGCNVTTHSLADFYQHEVWDDIQAALLNAPAECRACEYFGLCGGGPLETRYSTENGFANKSIYCDTYKAMFSRLRAHVENYVEPPVVSNRIASARETLLEMGAVYA